MESLYIYVSKYYLLFDARYAIQQSPIFGSLPMQSDVWTSRICHDKVITSSLHALYCTTNVSDLPPNKSENLIMGLLSIVVKGTFVNFFFLQSEDMYDKRWAIPFFCFFCHKLNFVQLQGYRLCSIARTGIPFDVATRTTG